MTSKEKFKRDYGYSYEAFRTWLKNHHDYTIIEARQLGKFDEFVGLYAESKLNSKFEDRNNFSHKAFATYVKNKHGYSLKDLPEDIYQPLLDEYTEYRIKKSFNKDELINLLSRYARASITGAEIDIHEHELELIALLEA
jgi:hypothetical protein